jgi:hypothetical protein
VVKKRENGVMGTINLAVLGEMLGCSDGAAATVSSSVLVVLGSSVDVVLVYSDFVVLGLSDNVWLGNSL